MFLKYEFKYWIEGKCVTFKSMDQPDHMMSVIMGQRQERAKWNELDYLK